MLYCNQKPLKKPSSLLLLLLHQFVYADAPLLKKLLLLEKSMIIPKRDQLLWEMEVMMSE